MEYFVIKKNEGKLEQKNRIQRNEGIDCKTYFVISKTKVVKIMCYDK